MPNNCVGCASARTTKLWINRLDSHKLKPEARLFSQVKVPNTVPHNEAVDILRRDVQRHSDAHSQ